MLAIHLVVDEGSREDQVRRCLESVDIGGRLIVGDLGAPPGVLSACADHGAQFVEIDDRRGMDVCRNRMIEVAGSRWHMMIEPWETLAAGADEIAERIGGEPASFTVIQGGVATRQVRLWAGGGFVNPVHERIDAAGTPSGCVLLGGEPGTGSRDLKLATDWVDRCPASPEPYYHRSCARLSLGDTAGFLRDAETYLFMEKVATIPITMTRYYAALIHCYEGKDAGRATQTLAPCLLERPLMAEFWCLLGDAFYHLSGRYDKAACFYEAAMTLGSRRLAWDDWPMDISKYRDHPSRMLASCRAIAGSFSQDR